MDMSNTQLNKLITEATKATLSDEKAEAIMEESAGWLVTLSQQELDTIYSGNIKAINELVRSHKDNISVDKLLSTITAFRKNMGDALSMIDDVFSGCMSLPNATIETATQCTLAALLEAMVGEDCKEDHRAFLEKTISKKVAAVAAKEKEKMTKVTTQSQTEEVATPNPEVTTTTTVVESTDAKVVAVSTVETKPAATQTAENPIAQLMRETMKEEMEEYGASISEAWKQALAVARYRIIRDGQKAWEATCRTGMFALKHRRSNEAAKAAAKAAALQEHAESMRLAGLDGIVV